MAAEKCRQVKWLRASMFQRSKATATLPVDFAPPMYKKPHLDQAQSLHARSFAPLTQRASCLQGSCKDEIPRKEQSAEAKLWKVPAKAKSFVCHQQIKHGTGILQRRETKPDL